LRMGEVGKRSGASRPRPGRGGPGGCPSSRARDVVHWLGHGAEWAARPEVSRLMDGMRRQWRRDARWAVAAFAVIACLVLASVLVHDRGGTIPAAYLLLPVLALALVAGPVATGVVGAVGAVALGFLYLLDPVPERPARFVAGVAIIGLAIAGSGLRARRERALLAQTAALAVAGDHERARLVVQRMMDEAPGLSAADSIQGVAARAVRVAVDLFGADAASYWEVEGDAVVLYARHPDTAWTSGTRMPAALMAAREGLRPGTRTSWVSHDDPAEDADRARARRDAMDRTGSRTGASTPIIVDGQTMAYMALAWTTDLPRTDTTIELLDRFSEQIALAKTVVRRRDAQSRAASLTQRLQASLLPELAHDSDQLAVHTLYRPGTRGLLLGGDFLDVMVRAEQAGDLAFLIGDVSGHGPEPAALAVRLSAAWRAIAALPLVPLEQWEEAMSAVLRDEERDAGMFATVVAGIASARTRTLMYFCAGHPPPLLMSGSEVTEAPFDGLPLGLSIGNPAPILSVPLPSGAAVLLVTDGIFEGRVAPDGVERVGWDAFVAFVQETLDGRSDAQPRDEELLGSLTDSMRRRNGGPLDDDVAAMLLRSR
jgi:serine phosphatase RsbU (regulator of sigma subunit)